MPTDTSQSHGEDLSAVLPRRLSGGQKIGIFAGALIFGALALLMALLWMQHPGAQNFANGNAVMGSIGLPYQAPAEAKPAPQPVMQPRPMPYFRPTPTVTTPAVDPGMISSIDAVSAVAANDPPGDRHHGGIGSGNGGVEDAFSRSLRPSDTGGTSYASLLNDAEYTIPIGTLIHCVLDTRLVSQLPGFVRCHIPAKEGVWNATGTGIMLDAGTVIVGQFRQALMEGQDRAFVLWTIARSPEQVVANLNSPAADQLGSSGIPGNVDNHVWERLLPTLVYSFVGYGPSLVSSALNNGRGNQYFQFGYPEQNLGESVLRQKMNIPPTLTVNQGDSVTIFVGHNIDFAHVYHFQMVDGVRTLSGGTR